jgi:hypothetical protein
MVVCAVIAIGDYFILLPPLNNLASELYFWIVIMVSVSTGIGLINLVLYHTRRISRRDNNWPYSVQVIVLLIATFAIGLGWGINSPQFTFLFANTFSVMIATLYGLVAFFIVGAAYRSFQARNMEAALLLVAAIFVMLKNAPIGETIWSGFPLIGAWLMNVPNTAGFRGIMMGTAIGAIGLGLRILLGKERGFLGGVQE